MAKMKSILVTLGLVLLLPGCALPTTEMVECPASGCEPPKQAVLPYDRETLALASKDLDCPESQLRFVDLQEDLQGVEGCGRRAAYLVACPDKAIVLDSDCHVTRMRDWQ